MQTSFAIGIASVGVMAVAIPDWRHVYFVMSAVPCIVCLPLIVSMPESPEWIAELHGNSKQETQSTYPGKCAMTLLLLCLLWALVGLTYYAMTTSAGDVSPHLAVRPTHCLASASASASRSMRRGRGRRAVNAPRGRGRRAVDAPIVVQVNLVLLGLIEIPSYMVTASVFEVPPQLCSFARPHDACDGR
jgi:hypothetical protein